MKDCENKYLGEIKRMNCGAMAKIIRYASSRDIDVEFEDGYISKNKSYHNFKNGQITNPRYPTVCGVGYLDGETIKNEFGETLNSYHVWRNMLDRCYNKKCCNYKNYGAVGVTVCEEWKSYAVFKEWFNDNYYELDDERVELDKDILIDGNNIYSPNTCIFVPIIINLMFKGHKRKNDLPKGIKRKGKKYTARITKHKQEYYLGIFNTKEEAYSSYINARNLYILELAEFYKETIPNRLYKRLIEIANIVKQI